MNYIRETVVKDIADLIGELKGAFEGDSVAILNRFKKDDYKSSISSGAKQLIMTYPMLCSNAISPKTMLMCSKSHERNCVTMLQLLFAAHTITVDEKENAIDYIKQSHNNIDMRKISVDGLLKSSAQIESDISNVMSRTLSNASVFEMAELVKADMRSVNNPTYFKESLNPISINDYKLRNVLEEMVVSEAEDPKPMVDINILTSEKISILNKNQQEEFKRQLLDTDVKKANELVPSLMIIRMVNKDASGKCDYINSIIGVKSRVIPVDSYDIINKVFGKLNDNSKLLKFVKATTREISFTKDFILALDKAKVDTLTNSKRGSSNPMWKVLEVRAIKARMNKLMRTTNNASAITSLLITQEEVDYMKKNNSIDLENISTAISLLSSYNLLSLIIVDESIEVAKFLYDGNDSFDTFSFDNLERESSGDNGMYKKVINLMTKIR